VGSRRAAEAKRSIASHLPKLQSTLPRISNNRSYFDYRRTNNEEDYNFSA